MTTLDQVMGGTSSLEQEKALAAELHWLGMRHLAHLQISESYLPLYAR